MKGASRGEELTGKFSQNTMEHQLVCCRWLSCPCFSPRPLCSLYLDLSVIVGQIVQQTVRMEIVKCPRSRGAGGARGIKVHQGLSCASMRAVYSSTQLHVSHPTHGGGRPLVAVTCGQMSLGLRRRKSYRMTCSMRNRNPDDKVNRRVKFRCIIRKFYSAHPNSVLGS